MIVHLLLSTGLKLLVHNNLLHNKDQKRFLSTKDIFNKRQLINSDSQQIPPIVTNEQSLLEYLQIQGP